VNVALLSIDIQMNYFPGGSLELERPLEAARAAARLIAAFRERGLPVVHIHHVSGVEKTGIVSPIPEKSRIHELVAPLPGEIVLPKGHINSFRGTGLEALLRARMVDRLVVMGMMTNMCVEAAARQAVDLGFDCTVAADACAARAWSWGGRAVDAADAHAAALAAIEFGYAKVRLADEIVASLEG